ADAAACSSAAPGVVSRRRLFLNTYGVTATNPKRIIFYMAFLPQFVDTAAPAAAQMLILAVTFVTLAIVNAALYTAFAGYAAKLLATGNARRIFHISGGSLLSEIGRAHV